MSVNIDLSRVTELSALAAPTWVRGVWQRGRVRTDGGESNDLEVLWIQTPTLYADIRALRANRSPASGVTEEGFAGWLAVEGQVCRWHRPIDLKPGAEDADQGAMFLDGKQMIEVGLFRNYLEEYQQIETGGQCFAASRGAFTVEAGKVRFASEGVMDILVTAGSYVTQARRDGTSSLRHGRYDAHTGRVDFNLTVGDPALFAEGSGAWTVWSDDVSDRDGLLAAVQAT